MVERGFCNRTVSYECKKVRNEPGGTNDAYSGLAARRKPHKPLEYAKFLAAGCHSPYCKDTVLWLSQFGGPISPAGVWRSSKCPKGRSES